MCFNFMLLFELILVLSDICPKLTLSGQAFAMEILFLAYANSFTGILILVQFICKVGSLVVHSILRQLFLALFLLSQNCVRP